MCALQGRGRGVAQAQGVSQRQAGVGQPPIGGNQPGSFMNSTMGVGAGGGGGLSSGGGMMSGLMGSMMGGGGANTQAQQRPQHKGIPTVIPTGISPQQPQQPSTSAAGPGTGPNLMQKLTDITAPGGDILSKGKELIFMKFGLGGGK